MGKTSVKHGLQTEVLPSRRGDIQLQKLEIGIDLDLDQVGWVDHLPDFSEVDSLSYSRCHVDLYTGRVIPGATVLRKTTNGRRP
jgi:hypothetical protein